MLGVGTRKVLPRRYLCSLLVAANLAMTACTPGDGSSTIKERANPRAANEERPMIRDLHALLAGVTSFGFRDSFSRARQKRMQRDYRKMYAGGVRHFAKDLLEIDTGNRTLVQATILLWNEGFAPSEEERPGIIRDSVSMDLEKSSLREHTIYRGEHKNHDYVGVFPFANAAMLFRAPKRLERIPWKVKLERTVAAVLEQIGEANGSNEAVVALRDSVHQTIGAATGRYASKMKVGKFASFRTGTVSSAFGTYDSARGLIDVRFLLAAVGTPQGRLPPATRAKPHIHIIVNDGVAYFSQPALPNSQWERFELGDVMEAIGVRAVRGSVSKGVPPLLDILKSPRATRAAVRTDMGDHSGFEATLAGQRTLGLLSIGSIIELVDKLGVGRANRVFDVEVPLNVTIREGFVTRASVDLSPIMRNVVRATMPKQQREQMDGVILRSEWRFTDIGEPVQIPFPPKGFRDKDRVARMPSYHYLAS